ncbi:hypothetical protein [Catellatospora sp. NPDC049133]|uniref:hypothetical protein n=1 Tax=Catellatospora sp. NPDC049133 TaxID=3155499 RepID=UPI0033D77D3A
MTTLTEVALVVRADRPPLRVIGEQAAPGLAVVAALDADDRYSGGWWLVHQASGWVLTSGATCAHCARRAAAELAAIDWTRPVGELTGDIWVQVAVTGNTPARAILRSCASAYTCEIPEGC